MGEIPILGPKQPPSERQRLALLRGLSGAEVAEEDRGLIMPSGYERKKKNKRSGKTRSKKSKKR